MSNKEQIKPVFYSSKENLFEKVEYKEGKFILNIIVPKNPWEDTNIGAQFKTASFSGEARNKSKFIESLIEQGKIAHKSEEHLYKHIKSEAQIKYEKEEERKAESIAMILENQNERIIEGNSLRDQLKKANQRIAELEKQLKSKGLTSSIKKVLNYD